MALEEWSDGDTYAAGIRRLSECMREGRKCAGGWIKDGYPLSIKENILKNIVFGNSCIVF